MSKILEGLHLLFIDIYTTTALPYRFTSVSHCLISKLCLDVLDVKYIGFFDRLVQY